MRYILTLNKMKIFQDKGKTLLPKVDSILLLSRLLIVLAAGVVLYNSELPFQGRIFLSILTGTFVSLLVLFWILKCQVFPAWK